MQNLIIFGQALWLGEGECRDEQRGQFDARTVRGDRHAQVLFTLDVPSNRHVHAVELSTHRPSQQRDGFFHGAHH